MTTTAKIAAKGTNNTGITEDLAKRCHDTLGRKVLAVVELVAESRSENRKGDEQVSLSILTIEPAPNSTTEEHLRNLARSFNYERRLAEGEEPTLNYENGQSVEPDLAAVVEAGARHEPHPYLSSSLAIDDSEHGPGLRPLRPDRDRRGARRPRRARGPVLREHHERRRRAGRRPERRAGRRRRRRARRGRRAPRRSLRPPGPGSTSPRTVPRRTPTTPHLSGQAYLPRARHHPFPDHHPDHHQAKEPPTP